MSGGLGDDINNCVVSSSASVPATTTSAPEPPVGYHATSFSAGAAAGLGVGVTLVVLLIIAFAAFLICCWRKRCSQSGANVKKDDIGDDKVVVNSPTGVDSGAKTRTSRSKRALGNDALKRRKTPSYPDRAELEDRETAFLS
ncbi:hypothetical protein NA57DRAFT_61399 [Rhizodiscina lignyota]|uniref:Uncharacterized protein n=1 Tax=Rhizodiscina lignyota TaxID=1504668 RepID=A0A9P4I2C0_9PEZI|nr:hypothetical protein NA57DRAFT_61399 [Rhizodiscina lignyota]